MMTRVKVSQGELEGALCDYEGGNYLAFKGIPYAKPPIGELRFKVRLSDTINTDN